MHKCRFTYYLYEQIIHNHQRLSIYAYKISQNTTYTFLLLLSWAVERAIHYTSHSGKARFRQVADSSSRCSLCCSHEKRLPRSTRCRSYPYRTPHTLVTLLPCYPATLFPYHLSKKIPPPRPPFTNQLVTFAQKFPTL